MEIQRSILFQTNVRIYQARKNLLFGLGNAFYGVPIIKLQLMTHLIFHARQNVHLQSILLWISMFTRSKFLVRIAWVYLILLLGVLLQPLLHHDNFESLTAEGLGSQKQFKNFVVWQIKKVPRFLFVSETRLGMDGFHKLKRKLDVRNGFRSVKDWFGRWFVSYLTR